MFLLSDRNETYENTLFWHLDVTKHCVFTGFVVTSSQKLCFSLGFAAFSHGFLRMSLVFFVFFAFSAFFAFSRARPWRRGGWRSARVGGFTKGFLLWRPYKAKLFIEITTDAWTGTKKAL